MVRLFAIGVGMAFAFIVWRVTQFVGKFVTLVLSAVVLIVLFVVEELIQLVRKLGSRWPRKEAA
jgi:hypothetical protein